MHLSGVVEPFVVVHVKVDDDALAGERCDLDEVEIRDNRYNQVIYHYIISYVLINKPHLNCNL